VVHPSLGRVFGDFASMGTEFSLNTTQTFDPSPHKKKSWICGLWYISGFVMQIRILRRKNSYFHTKVSDPWDIRFLLRCRTQIHCPESYGACGTSWFFVMKWQILRRCCMKSSDWVRLPYNIDAVTASITILTEMYHKPHTIFDPVNTANASLFSAKPCHALQTTMA